MKRNLLSVVAVFLVVMAVPAHEGRPQTDSVRAAVQADTGSVPPESASIAPAVQATDSSLVKPAADSAAHPAQVQSVPRKLPAMVLVPNGPWMRMPSREHL